jgi:hypothetical protein
MRKACLFPRHMIYVALCFSERADHIRGMRIATMGQGRDSAIPASRQAARTAMRRPDAADTRVLLPSSRKRRRGLYSSSRRRASTCGALRLAVSSPTSASASLRWRLRGPTHRERRDGEHGNSPRTLERRNACPSEVDPPGPRPTIVLPHSRPDPLDSRCCEQDPLSSPRTRSRPPKLSHDRCCEPSESLHAGRARPRHLPTASVARPCTAFRGLRRGA